MYYVMATPALRQIVRHHEMSIRKQQRQEYISHHLVVTASAVVVV